MQFLQRQESARQRTQVLGTQFAVIAAIALALTLALGLVLGALLTWLELLLIGNWLLAGWPVSVKGIVFGAFCHVAVLIPLVVYVMRTRAPELVQQVRGQMDSLSSDEAEGDSSLSRLNNVVEEMAVAAGMPAPRVRLWGNRHTINSVTLGFSPADASIYVTRMAVDGLSRQELQALVAYSMSQILNGDMALNMRLATLVHAFSMGPRTALWLVNLPVVNGRISGGRFLFFLLFGLPAGIALTLASWPLFLGGAYLQSRVGRERQRLGDASVIQFTRDAEPFENLLFKALAHTATQRIQGVPALRGEFAHCCFVAPGFDRILAPQDSLTKRLLALNPRLDVPHFASEELDVWRKDVRVRVAAAKREREEVKSPQVANLGPLLQVVNVAAVLQEDFGTDVRLRLDMATASLVALLIDRNPVTRARQMEELGKRLEPASCTAVVKALTQEGALSPGQRSLALDTRLPHLRSLPGDVLLALRAAVIALESLDRTVDVFDFALARSVLVFIDGFTRPRPPHGSAGFDRLTAEVDLLFSVAASFSSREHADRAFEVGLRHLGLTSQFSYRPRQNWVAPMDQALERFRELTPGAKSLLFEGLEKTVMFDGSNTMAERELLRAVAACLQCPLPRMAAAS